MTAAVEKLVEISSVQYCTNQSEREVLTTVLHIMYCAIVINASRPPTNLTHVTIKSNNTCRIHTLTSTGTFFNTVRYGTMHIRQYLT